MPLKMKLSSTLLVLTLTGSGLLALALMAQQSPDGQGVPVHPIPPPPLHNVPSNGLAMTPPMGWNSWNKFRDNVDDRAVREIADAMVKNGMKDAGYVYVNIDDTWQGKRDAQGNIQPNKKFPDMKALADYVHSKGLKIGIYSSPGPQTCAHYEGSYGHEQQDTRTFAAWGFDYLKYDWCSAGKIYPHDAETLQAIYQKMGDALHDAGRPILYSLCEYGYGHVWTWGPKVSGNVWRTTGDIGDSWASMSKIGFNQNDLAKWAGPGHWNDPDMLEVGNGGMTDTEYRTHFSLWSMLAAPLLAGNDLRTVSPDILRILTNRDVIAIDQDRLGKQATRAWKSGEQEIWTRPLANGDMAVALFNRADKPAEITVRWQELGMNGVPKSAKDLWRHKAVKLHGPQYQSKVSGHGVQMLRVRF